MVPPCYAYNPAGDPVPNWPTHSQPHVRPARGQLFPAYKARLPDGSQVLVGFETVPGSAPPTQPHSHARSLALSPLSLPPLTGANASAAGHAASPQGRNGPAAAASNGPNLTHSGSAAGRFTNVAERTRSQSTTQQRGPKSRSKVPKNSPGDRAPPRDRSRGFSPDHPGSGRGPGSTAR